MKTLRLLFGLFIVATAIYVSWKVVPVYISNYQFQEAIDDSARMAAVNAQKSEEDLRIGLFEQAQSLKLPLRPEDIKVQRGNGEVMITADYSVHVELPVYPLDFSFHPSSNRQALTFR
jgi:predicted membrane protein